MVRLNKFSLKEKYDIPIICSDKCAEAIKSYKSNLSMFFLPNKPFVINGKTQHVKNNDSIELLGKKIIFIETPGHTSSSITILIDDVEGAEDQQASINNLFESE